MAKKRQKETRYTIQRPARCGICIEEDTYFMDMIVKRTKPRTMVQVYPKDGWLMKYEACLECGKLIKEEPYNGEWRRGVGGNV